MYSEERNGGSDLMFSDTKACRGLQSQLIEDVWTAWEQGLHNSGPAGSCRPLTLLLFSSLSDRLIPTTQPPQGPVDLHQSRLGVGGGCHLYIPV